MEPNEFERGYAAKEIEILRGKISEYVGIITQTERLAVGSAGVVAAFILNNMADAELSARLAASTIPLFFMIMGWLRSVSMGALVLDITAYIDVAERQLISHEKLGFQKSHETKSAERVKLVTASALWFWRIGIAGCLLFLLLIGIEVI